MATLQRQLIQIFCDDDWSLAFFEELQTGDVFRFVSINDDGSCNEPEETLWMAVSPFHIGEEGQLTLYCSPLNAPGTQLN